MTNLAISSGAKFVCNIIISLLGKPQTITHNRDKTDLPRLRIARWIVRVNSAPFSQLMLMGTEEAQAQAVVNCHRCIRNIRTVLTVFPQKQHCLQLGVSRRPTFYSRSMPQVLLRLVPAAREASRRRNAAPCKLPFLRRRLLFSFGLRRSWRSCMR